MPSDTTADSRDSMPASIAMVKAGATKPRMVSHDVLGRLGLGSDAWISPNRSPIVSTGRWKSCTSAVMATSATKGAGIRRLSRGHSRMIANEASETPAAVQLTAPACWA